MPDPIGRAFRHGDVVRLKSGGANMLVILDQHEDEDAVKQHGNRITAIWASGGEIKTGQFDPATLTLLLTA